MLRCLEMIRAYRLQVNCNIEEKSSILRKRRFECHIRTFLEPNRIIFTSNKFKNPTETHSTAIFILQIWVEEYSPSAILSAMLIDRKTIPLSRYTGDEMSFK